MEKTTKLSVIGLGLSAGLAWAVTNVVIWGSVLSYVLILVIHMLFFINE